MELLNVQSSQIASIGHDGQSTLQVLFKKGGLYQFEQVSSAEFDALLNADSIGKAFNLGIKGKKPGTKLEGTEWPAKAAATIEGEPTVNIVEVEPQPEQHNREDNQEVDAVERKADLLVQNASNIRVIDQVTQLQASDFLLAIKAIRGEIADTFRPMKDAAFRAHRVICEQEKKLDSPLAAAEVAVKSQIGSYVQMQQAIARAAEAAARAAEMERARIAAELESQEQAIEDALALEAHGDMAGAEAVMNNPAPAPLRYVAQAPIAPQVAQVSGVTTREDFDFRVVNEALIPREYLLVNESALRSLGKTTRGRAKVPGVEFFSRQIVSASRGRG